MRTILILGLSMLAGSAALSADREPAAEKAVTAAVAAFNEAARAGDRARLTNLLSDDLIYGHSSGRTETKQQCIDNLVKAKSNFQHEGQVVRVYGRAAYVQTKVVAHNVTNGQPAKLPLVMLQVWAKEGKQWRMVARQTARLAP
jgi:ketosteroid isomerase-like protein